jgi:hypothetical protein
VGAEALIRLLVHVLHSCWNSAKIARSGGWSKVEATVTAEPQIVTGLFSTKVEFPFSYRIDGELYTGLHEEPTLMTQSEYKERFAEGRTFVVRVNPKSHEISFVHDGDQSDSIQKQLQRIDQQHKRDATQD